MKHILVPCDFSPQAKEAFKMAVDIATKSRGTITVLHVMYIPAMYDPNFTGEAIAFNPTVMAEMERDAKKAFEAMKNESGRNQDIRLEITMGAIVDSIQRLTKAKQIDLIVMGTAGASGIQETFIGSNTEKVVRFSPTPVLAVRKAARVDSMHNILLPTTAMLDQTDFVSKVKELQHFLQATLHILLVNTPVNFRRDAEGIEALEEFVKHYQITNYQLHFKSYRDEDEGIIDFASSINADMIVMATHARRGVAHLFKGSITEDVVNHIDNIPVWTYSLRK